MHEIETRFALIREELLRAYGCVRLPAMHDTLAVVQTKLSVQIPEMMVYWIGRDMDPFVQFTWVAIRSPLLSIT